MGSVSRDYKCPCCGRVGFGGYAPDSIGFPICTVGEHSCLWFQLMERNLGPVRIIAHAIGKLFEPKIALPDMVSRIIADMLTGWEYLERKSDEASSGRD